MIYARGERPRADVVCSNKLIVFPISELMTRDLVAVVIQTPLKLGSTRIMCASAYFQPEDEIILPLELQQQHQYCRDEGMQLILGCNANAHHPAWSSTDTNDRGEYLLEYLINF